MLQISQNNFKNLNIGKVAITKPKMGNGDWTMLQQKDLIANPSRVDLNMFSLFFVLCTRIVYD